MFKLMSNENTHRRFLPVDTTSTPTLYEGQLVKMGEDGGVNAIAAASGAADTTGAQIIKGIINGFNNRTPTHVALYGQSGTPVITQAAQIARDFLGVEGKSRPKGDPQLFAEITELNANMLIKGKVMAAVNVPPTLLTETTGSTTGLTITTNAAQVTGVANRCTIYCRSGANKGISRVCDDTSTTTHTVDLAFPYDIAIGDTFVVVPFTLGDSFIQVNDDSGYVGMWVAADAAPATNYFLVDVYDFDLSVAGEEWVTFKFNPIHFAAAR